MSEHKHAAPSLPEVVDEAADTPAWVPALGLGLFALIALVFAMRLAFPDAQAPSQVEANDQPAAPAAADSD